MSRLFLACALVGTLSACDLFSDQYRLEEIRLSESVNEDGDPDAVVGVALDAKQRLVFTPTVPVIEPSDEFGRDGFAKPTVRDRQVICAEPSPDALSALATELSASAGGTGILGSGTEANAEFNRRVTETLKTLGQRTQTIQLMRDTLYRACEAYANGALDQFGYSVILGAYERFAMQALGIDALRTSGGGGGAEDRVQRITFLQERLDDVEVRLANAEADKRRVDASLLETKAELKKAEEDGKSSDKEISEPALERKPVLEEAQTSLMREQNDAQSRLNLIRETRSELERGILALNGVSVTKQADGSITTAPVEVPQNGGGSGGDGIVKLASLAAGGVDGTNPTQRSASAAACLMWFARNPHVTADAVLLQHVDPKRTPAVALMCAKVIASLSENGAAAPKAPPAFGAHPGAHPIHDSYVSSK